MLVAAAGPAVGKPQTADDLFQRAFGRQRPAAVTRVDLAVRLAAQPVGALAALLPADGSEPKLEGQPLLDLLGPRLQQPTAEALQGLAAAGPVALADLRTLGLGAAFDTASLELHLEIPPALRGVVAIAIRQRSAPAEVGVRLQPAAFSGYINWNLDALTTVDDTTEQSLAGAFDAALRWHDWVLEGRASYSSTREQPFRRGDLRLVRDFPDRALRLAVGEVSYPVTGFQAFRPLVGAVLARNFELDPYHLTQPIAEAGFMLEEPSRVEIWVNGFLEKTMRLPAGPYQARDFFLEAGVNQIEIVVEGPSGTREVLELSIPFDFGLLRPGLAEFALTAGLQTDPDASNVRYDTESPALSSLFRRGITDRWTAGVNLQAGTDRTLLGIRSDVATAVGTLRFDLAHLATGGSSDSSGGAARVGFERRWRSRAGGRAPTTLLATAIVRSPHFSPEATQDNPPLAGRGGFQARVTRPIGWGVSASLGVDLEQRRSPQPATLRTVSAGFRKRFQRLAVAVDLGLRTGEADSDDRWVRVFASWVPRPRGETLEAVFDSRNETTRLAWRHTPSLAIGQPSYGLSLESQRAGQSAVGDVALAADRAELGLRLEATHRDGTTSGNAELRAAGAVAFADGVFAFGRPISRGFAILASHPALAGQVVGLERVGSSYLARTGRWPTALLGDLEPYRQRVVTVEATDLPVGFDLGPGLFTVAPTYKSGVVVAVGSGATAIVGGTLVDPERNPMGRAVFEITDNHGEHPMLLFTSGTGRFRVEGLRPGPYRLRWPNAPDAFAELVVPADAVGILDIGLVQARTTEAAAP